jgi:hypothetical protein
MTAIKTSDGTELYYKDWGSGQHANDMHDLLVSHEGRPMLEK